jgi:hypothetical protein
LEEDALEQAPAHSEPAHAAQPYPGPPPDGLADEVAALRWELDALRADVTAMREQLRQLIS